MRDLPKKIFIILFIGILLYLSIYLAFVLLLLSPIILLAPGMIISSKIKFIPNKRFQILLKWVPFISIIQAYLFANIIRTNIIALNASPPPEFIGLSDLNWLIIPFFFCALANTIIFYTVLGSRK